MKRGITPIIAIILLLLMTVAAAGAAYLWITKIQGMMTESITGGFLSGQKAENTKICIDTPWKDSTDLKFTIRNCGKYDISASDFAKTGYYIDNVNTACTATTGAFTMGELRTVTCAAVYSGVPTTPTPGYVYPVKAIKVTTVYNMADTVTYQHRD